MSIELPALLGFILAAGVSFAATPVAIRIAARTGCYDHPREYRRHAAPTPFLGGAAVLFAVLVATPIVQPSGSLVVVLGCAIVLCVLGTIDDRGAVSPKWRVLAEAGAAGAVFAAGLGWDTSLSTTADVALTIVWVVGVVNAFNLMDNLDGACGTVAATAAMGVGVLAAIKGEGAVAALAFALAGACAGFLPWNLEGPARIFLGDGGSMPIGFLVAVLAMAASRHANGGNAGVLLGALFVGLPLLDATLVVFSRMRRGVTPVTGGRDHLTHRVQLALGSPRAVAVTLAFGQSTLCAVAIVGYQLGAAVLAAFGLAVFLAGMVAILVLDTARWRPDGIAVGPAHRNVEPAIEAPARANAG